MKKLIIILLSILSLFLISCNFGKEENTTNNVELKKTSSTNPEDIIKMVQVNNFTNMPYEDSEFVKFDGSMNLQLEAQGNSANAQINFDGESSSNVTYINMDMQGDANVDDFGQKIVGNFKSKMSMYSSLEKVYIKLDSLEVQSSSHPQAQMFLPFISSYLGKWYVSEIPETDKKSELYTNLKKEDIEKQLETYSLFKVEKETSEGYEVSLNKTNIATVAYNLSKTIDDTFDGTIEDIEKEIEDVNLTGILKIDEDQKHFNFKGELSIGDIKYPTFNIDYTKEHFVFSNEVIKSEFKFDNENFECQITMLENPENVIKISGVMNSKKIDLTANVESTEGKVNLGFKANNEQITKLSIQEPTDASSLKDTFGGLMQNLNLGQ